MLISTQNVSMTTICNKTKQKILRKSVWLQSKQNITHHHSQPRLQGVLSLAQRVRDTGLHGKRGAGKAMLKGPMTGSGGRESF